MTKLRVPLVAAPLRYAAVVTVLVVIVYFSLVEVAPGPPEPGPFWDKRLHFVAYCGLALSLAYATATYRDRSQRRIVAVLGAAMAVGIGIELLQGLLPYRYFGWGDLLANAMGAVVAALWFPLERYVQYDRARQLIG